MSTAYEKQLARIRQQSRQREEVFEMRYGGSDDSTALRLARRWRAALSVEPLDWFEISAIREEARFSRVDTDVALFGFANAIERDYTLLRRAEIEDDFA